jgi:hypothetical protein
MISRPPFPTLILSGGFLSEQSYFVKNQRNPFCAKAYLLIFELNYFSSYHYRDIFDIKLSIMLKKFLFLSLITGLLWACNNSSQNADNAATTEETTEATTGLQGKLFGESFEEAADIMSYEKLMTAMSSTDSMEVQFTGTVQEVCQAKGCWMTIASSADDNPVMVKFKDYGFFMPKDISGKKVVMNGRAFREVTPVDELRHYAEDAGKSKEEIEAITEPVEELKFIASGVVLLEDQ